MRSLFALLLLGCAAPPPPAPAPAPASASASASTSASDSTSPTTADASVPPSPAERALVAALKKAHAALVACHRSAKSVAGDMTMRVVIGVNGKVEATSIDANATVPASLAQCIESRVREVRVEIAPTTVTLPFHFLSSPYDGPTVLYGSGPFDPGY